jgi:hypothetical protein
MKTVNTPIFIPSIIFAAYLWGNRRPVQKVAVGSF